MNVQNPLLKLTALGAGALLLSGCAVVDTVTSTLGLPSLTGSADVAACNFVDDQVSTLYASGDFSAESSAALTETILEQFKGTEFGNAAIGDFLGSLGTENGGDFFFAFKDACIELNAPLDKYADALNAEQKGAGDYLLELGAK